MSDRQYEATRAAVAQAAREFAATPAEAYGGKAQLKAFLQHTREASFKEWSRGKPCSIESCDNPAIENSHAISVAMLRDSVAVKGHVRAPNITGQGILTIDFLGINKATVFPGFCEAHERLFCSFETKKYIANDSELSLQMYRSVQRELHRATHWCEQLSVATAAYFSSRDAFILRRAREILIAQNLRPLSELPPVKSDFAKEYLSVRLLKLTEMVKTLQHNILPYVRACALGGCTAQTGVVHKTKVPFRIPVALSGSGEFRASDKTVRVAIGVIPQFDRTNIFTVGAIDDAQELIDYWSRRTQDFASILRMVASWMSHGTDQWYFHPEQWAKLSDETKEVILNDLAADDKDIATSAAEIFSSIRMVL